MFPLKVVIAVIIVSLVSNKVTLLFLLYNCMHKNFPFLNIIIFFHFNTITLLFLNILLYRKIDAKT